MQKLLSIWPTMAALSTALGVPYPTVQSWARRGIPRNRYRQIISAAKAVGFEVTADDLLPPENEEDAA